ncbi:Group XV phospholipase A2 [Trichoplax sp. H2]|uniref:Group XV phospholipase A2 n=1 Tax=Trichoplax adhaerens TaxID=10228 RepID=B3S5G0_TRIAD|nr:hypothetical protein TRIADDRAFT_59602 [Trichoplax adhaerens]EDV22036.1 hypothetical protein TRIADDRAFT_59602 [Trichoplax adhaerens]RDD36998.1 Group XV phospholipase A2 [Trichoplax sp. H2]|eukprot:XP_002115673.1 hypothetical protein TRIADDRAFT_59602 [Trichoplax adhaerens]
MASLIGVKICIYFFMVWTVVGPSTVHALNWKQFYSQEKYQSMAKEFHRFYSKSNFNRDKVSQFAKEIKANGTNVMHPVVLITALGGAQLEAKLNRTTAPYWFCDKKTDWELVWLNVDFLLPFVIRCWENIMQLKYDSKNHVYSPAHEGIKIRVRNGTKHIRFIDPQFGLRGVSMEYGAIIDSLVFTGYTKDKNIIAFPFDWRIGADAYYLKNGVFHYLKLAIEQAYSNNSNIPVVCVGESMGNAMFNLFLNTYVDQKWKDKYVKAHISLSGVYAGAGQVIYSVISPSGGVLPPVVNFDVIRSVIRTYGSSAWLLPNRKFWKDYPFVRTKKKNYTAEDFGEIFSRLKLHNITEMWHNTRNLSTLHAPNVTVYCWHGINVPTPNSFYYKDDNFEKQPDITHTDGDGTVPLRSLQVCQNWKKQQTKPVSVRSFPGVSHMGILGDESVIMGILSIATGGHPSHG